MLPWQHGVLARRHTASAGRPRAAGAQGGRADRAAYIEAVAQPDLVALLPVLIGGAPFSGTALPDTPSEPSLAVAYATGVLTAQVEEEYAKMVACYDQDPLHCSLNSPYMPKICADLLRTLRFAARIAKRARHAQERERAVDTVGD